MFQFAGFPPHSYGFTLRWHAVHAGFPHSDIRGSMLMCSSPRLFAAYRVFHRLPVPGHPPCALLCLTSCTSGPHQLKLFQSGSPVVLTCSYRRICKACPSCSLVLLAIAFSIYIRVIDSNFFYQRRGLMFDVSDLVFRSDLSLIQFSRYETYISDMYPDALHVISTQEWLPGCSSHAKQHVL